MIYYKLLILNGMGTTFLNLSTQMVVEPIYYWAYYKCETYEKIFHLLYHFNNLRLQRKN